MLNEHRYHAKIIIIIKQTLQLTSILQQVKTYEKHYRSLQIYCIKPYFIYNFWFWNDDI